MAKTSQVTTLEDPQNPDVKTDTTEQATASESVKSSVGGGGDQTELSGNTATITILPTGEDGGNEAVSVSLNGYMYQIPRNVPCKVPTEVLEILKNAQTTVYQQGPAGVVERTVQRFPFVAH